MLADDMNDRASRYAQQRGLRIKRHLGSGKDGTVLSTNMQSAIKVFVSQQPYVREKAVYLRLRDRHVADVHGHHVPEFINSDDALLILEITTVTRPFVLDFAGAYLDWPPDFSDEVLRQWEEDKREQFGDHWPAVQRIVATLRDLYGIYLFDLNPGNIAFADQTS